VAFSSHHYWCTQREPEEEERDGEQNKYQEGKTMRKRLAELQL